MSEQGTVQILLIWVNAERQLERQFMTALADHAEFSRPEIVERDSHQAEISAAFPSTPNILEAIIDALLLLPGFDVAIQGAERERVPTVVFRAEALGGRRKTAKTRTVRRHFDEELTAADVHRDSHSERVLSTSEMAMTSGPRPGLQDRAAAKRRQQAEASGAVVKPGGATSSRRRANRQSKLVPLIKKVARIILTEEEPNSPATRSDQQQESDSEPPPS